MIKSIFFQCGIGVLALLAGCNLEKIDDTGGNNPSNCNNDTFEASFGGGIYDSATAVIKTLDGGYFITGNTKKQQNSLLLFKTNLCKDNLLYLSAGNQAFNTFTGNAICPAAQGGYIIGGTNDAFDALSPYIISVATDGTLRDIYEDVDEDAVGIYDIINLKAGGYAASGTIDQIGTGIGGGSAPYLILFDNNLNPTHKFKFSGSSFGGGLSEVVQLTTGEIVGIGSEYIGFGFRIALRGVTAAGAEYLKKNISFQNIGGDNSIYGAAATASTDGNFVLAGTVQLLIGGRKAFLQKITPSGDIIWEKDYTTTAMTIVGAHEALAVIATQDGGYLMAGRHKLGTGNQDIFLLKTDANGNYQWDRSYGGTGNETINDLLQDTDGGFFMVGHSNSFNTAGEEGKVYFLKTDALGKIL